MLLSTLVSSRSAERLASGHERTARAYRSTLNSVSSFCPRNISLKQCFTQKFLIDYEHFLENKHLSKETISFYMRMLRSLYNYAVDCHYVLYVPKLFSCVYTGVGTTAKRAVSTEVIRKLKDYPVPSSSHLQVSRDLFLFSLYAQGISFVDMAYLQKENLIDDTLIYYRRKTGTKITVSLVPEACAILKKYAPYTTGPYLLPIIKVTSDRSPRLQYESALRTHNRRLQQLGVCSGFKQKLTSYVARHSWATIAYHSGVDISVISQAMGHRTEEVTRIYLASFSIDTLMNANKLIISNLSKETDLVNKKVCHLTGDRLTSLQT